MSETVPSYKYEIAWRDSPFDTMTRISVTGRGYTDEEMDSIRLSAFRRARDRGWTPPLWWQWWRWDEEVRASDEPELSKPKPPEPPASPSQPATPP